jgi:hypothetical protein
MSIKKISPDELKKLVNELIKNERVYGVQARWGRFDFDELKNADDLRLDYDVTLLPPKKYFQPTVETMLSFETEGKYKSQYDNEKFIVIGVHPYDMVAINQMDKIFSQDYYDEHYMKRRNNATIIVCDVARPSENVFASSMGMATVQEGFDVLLTDIGDGFVAEAITEKGEKILNKAKDLKPASEKDLKKRQQV